ncbi:MAG: hypothetical protein ACE5OZ_25475 [Candidatus Heimdallarchaeota archaeon]
MTAPVHSISIINEAGLPVVDISVEDALEDATLLAGLTSAIQAFATEFSGGRNIHSLDFEDYSLIYSPVSESKKGILCVRMSKEISDISEMTDLIMSEIIRKIEKAGTKEIEYHIVMDETREKFSKLLKSFLELSYLNEILGPHGYSLRALNRSLCVISASEDGSELKGTCDYRHSLTEEEVSIVLEETLPKIKLMAKNSGGTPSETTVISFPNINRTGLASFFPRQNPESTTSAIILLFDEIDQVSLYKHSPSLSKRLIEISDKLASQWSAATLEPGYFQDLLAMGRFHIETKKRFDRDSVSFQLLRKISKKNLDRVVRNVIVGQQVVLAGDPILAELAVRTLEAFALHRVISIELGAREKSAANIATTSRDHISEYTDPTVVVDLEKAKVIGGTSSKFCARLLKAIQKKSRLDAISLVETEVKRIVTQATTLADLAQDGETHEDRLKQFNKELQEDSLEIVTEIAAAANPLIRQGIRQTSEAISSVESYLAKF